MGFQKGNQLRKGTTVSDETKRKISKKLKGKNLSEEHKKKISDKKKIYFSNTENRKKQSITIKAWHEKKGYMPSWCKGLTKETDERVAKISEVLMGHIGAFAGKKRPEHSKTMTGRKQTNFHIKNRFKKKKNTSIEIKIETLLQDNKIGYQKQEVVCGFCVDFFLPEFDIVIEADGDYWHKYPKGTEKDSRENKIITSQGFKMLRFWEHEIHGDINKCFDIIQEAIENCKDIDVK